MKTSFGSYEFVRMFLPGVYFGLVSVLFLWVILPFFPWYYLDAFTTTVLFLFLAFSSGLTMYLRETPKKRKAFMENQPSSVIQNMARTMKGVDVLSDDDARRLYFHLLNTAVPPVAHEKIFFFGTVYHIVVHVRRTTFWFAILGTAITAYQWAMYGSMTDVTFLALFSAVMWAMYGLNVRYNKSDRSMQENYQDQIVWLEMNRGLVEKMLKEWKRG